MKCPLAITAFERPARARSEAGATESLNVRHGVNLKGEAGLEDICCLDREALGRLAFWREFRLAAKEKGSIKILTHKKDLDALPIDLKLLLGKVANDDKRVGAILGVSQSARHPKVQFASDTIGIMIIGLTTMFKIFLSRNQYRFRVLNNPDGTIEIIAYPRNG